MMTDAPNNTPVRVLLIDDHSILRKGLRQLLETEDGIDVCGEADNGEDAIAQAFSLKPDVILMDINLPKVTGYEASRAILTAWPGARILVLTNQDDADVVRKFMDLDIKGFVLKDIPLEQLIDAIYRITQGEKIALTAELAEKAQKPRYNAREESAFQLTEREKEVLKALAKGHSNQQLADLLTVSPKTVHNHLYNIYGKIGVNTRAEAIIWAIESGFTER